RIGAGLPFPETQVEDSEEHVAVTDDEIAVGITHRRGAVAASAGLVHHERSVALRETAQQGDGIDGRHDSRDGHRPAFPLGCTMFRAYGNGACHVVRT